jgi:uncharacterized protein (DUF2062 family)
MPKRFLRRYLPTADQLRNIRGLGFIGEKLFDPELWHLSRRSVRMGLLVGMFSAWIPAPQMPLACLGAVTLRCNLPLAAALCWISNPFTTPVMVFLAYSVGAGLMAQPALVLPSELSVAIVIEQVGAIGAPFLLGSVVCGLVSGLCSGLAIDLIWRVAVARRWRRRLHDLDAGSWRHRVRAAARSGLGTHSRHNRA